MSPSESPGLKRKLMPNGSPFVPSHLYFSIFDSFHRFVYCRIDSYMLLHTRCLIFYCFFIQLIISSNKIFLFLFSPYPCLPVCKFVIVFFFLALYRVKKNKQIIIFKKRRRNQGLRASN